MMKPIEDLMRQYAYSDSATFAAALSRMCGLPIVEFRKDGERFHTAVVIEGDVPSENRFLDVHGEVSAKQINKRFGAFGKVDLIVRTEAELMGLSIVSEDGIKEASAAATALIDADKLEVNVPMTGDISKPAKPSTPWLG